MMSLREDDSDQPHEERFWDCGATRMVPSIFAYQLSDRTPALDL
jgi:hypothetical protein